MYLSIFLRLKNPILNFFNFMSNRVLLSYKPLSYKRACIVAKQMLNIFIKKCVFSEMAATLGEALLSFRMRQGNLEVLMVVRGNFANRDTCQIL